jgi:methionine synthase I (cobalamin-dependent)
MGSRLLARGLDPLRDDPCLWNLDRPDAVRDVHAIDVAAGARVLFTNTFGANRAWLRRYGRASDLDAINRAAIALARCASPAFAVGDIGPSAADEAAAIAEQAAILEEAGVDALIFETFRLDQAVATLRRLREGEPRSALPLLASLWDWPEPVEDAARRLVDAGADVVGLNCRPALPDVLPLARRIARAVAVPLLVKPGIDPGDPEPSATPAAFAALVPELLDHNVRLIGGCCGTTDAHVEAVARACPPHRNPERRGTAP